MSFSEEIKSWGLSTCLLSLATLATYMAMTGSWLFYTTLLLFRDRLEKWGRYGLCPVYGDYWTNLTIHRPELCSMGIDDILAYYQTYGRMVHAFLMVVWTMVWSLWFIYLCYSSFARLWDKFIDYLFDEPLVMERMERVRMAQEAKLLARASGDEFAHTRHSRWEKLKRWWYQIPPKPVCPIVYMSEVGALKDPEPESMRAGSEIFQGAPGHSCGIVIYRRLEEGGEVTYVPVGQAFRFQKWMILPTHVIGGEAAFFVKNARGMEGIRSSQALEIYTDTSVVELKPAEWSLIGAKSANICAATDNGEMVKCSGLQMNGTLTTYSLGKVRNSEIFGELIYEGSTQKGFSGGVYLKGKKVIGMHLSGGPVNRGISLSYIKCLLEIHELEETGHAPEGYDWLFSEYKDTDKRLPYQRTGDPDRVVIRVKGLYHFVDRDTLEEYGVHGYDVDGEGEIRPRGGRRGRKNRRRSLAGSEDEEAFPSGKKLPADMFGDGPSTINKPPAPKSGEDQPALPRAEKITVAKQVARVEESPLEKEIRKKTELVELESLVKEMGLTNGEVLEMIPVPKPPKVMSRGEKKERALALIKRLGVNRDQLRKMTAVKPSTC